jgi:transcriptional regulator with XRE-family HTH domain
VTTTETFAKRLELGRGRAGLKRLDLERATGASKATVGRWFSGQAIPDAREAVALARLLGCTVEYLVDREVTDPNEGGRVVLRLGLVVRTGRKPTLERLTLEPRRVRRRPGQPRARTEGNQADAGPEGFPDGGASPA